MSVGAAVVGAGAHMVSVPTVAGFGGGLLGD